MLTSNPMRYPAIVMVGYLSVVALPAPAQDGGLLASLTVGFGLESVDGNRDDDGTRAVTRLGLALSSRTDVQDFAFSLRSGIRFGETNGDSVIDPVARLSYTRRSANSRLTFGGSYTERDLDDTRLSQLLVANPNDDPGIIGDEFILQDVTTETGGTRIDTSLRLGFETGLQSPVQLSFNAALRDRSFRDVGDAALFGSRTDNLRASASFRIDPRITLRLNTGYTRFAADDAVQTRRNTTTYGVAADFDVTKLFQLSVNVQHRQQETTTGGVTQVTDGLSYGVTATRDMGNGTLGAAFDSTANTAGRRSSLMFNREMDLRDGTALRAEIGAVRTEDGTVSPLLGLAVQKPLKRGDLSFALTQSAVLRNNVDSVILTNMSARYRTPLSPRHSLNVTLSATDQNAVNVGGLDRSQVELAGKLRTQINDLSSWSAGLNLGQTRIEQAGGGDEIEDELAWSLGYRRSLTRDWDLVSEYRQTETRNNLSADRSIKRVSLGIERTFSWRP